LCQHSKRIEGPISQDSLSMLHFGRIGVGKVWLDPLKLNGCCRDWGTGVRSDVDQGIRLGGFMLRRLETSATGQANKNKGKRVLKISR
jgi:hypothetical protein